MLAEQAFKPVITMQARRIREAGAAHSWCVQAAAMEVYSRLLDDMEGDMDESSSDDDNDDYYDHDYGLSALSAAALSSKRLRNELKDLAREMDGKVIRMGTGVSPRSARRTEPPVGTIISSDFPTSSPLAWSKPGAEAMRDMDDLQVELDLDFTGPSEEMDDESDEEGGGMPNAVEEAGQGAAHVVGGSADVVVVMSMSEVSISEEPLFCALSQRTRSSVCESPTTTTDGGNSSNGSNRNPSPRGGKIATANTNKSTRGKVVTGDMPWMKDTHSSRSRRRRCRGTTGEEATFFIPSTKKCTTPVKESPKRQRATVKPAKTVKTPDR